MDIAGSLVLFVVFIFIYLIIVEIFVMLFRMTGLTDEKARFQVISMLTNSGYTTREAEVVVNSRRRRKLARFVMIFGYSFTVTIVSAVVNIFLQFRHTLTGGVVAFIPMIIGFIGVVWFLKRNRWTNTLVDRVILKIANKLMYDKNSNPIIIMDDYGDLVMAKIDLKMMPKEIDGKKLSDSNIKNQHGINVLLKQTSEGESLPNAETTFDIGDTVVVMGKEKIIREVFGLRQD